jgi:hypothetical protein
VEALTLDGVKGAVMQQLHAGNIEVRPRHASGGARGVLSLSLSPPPPPTPRHTRTYAHTQDIALTHMYTHTHTRIHTHSPQVNVVGDFEAQELEGLVLAYLGTVAPRPEAGMPQDRCGGALMVTRRSDSPGARR